MHGADQLHNRLNAAKRQKNLLSQIAEILHILHKLRKKRARNTSIVQVGSKITFHTITSSIRPLSRAISRAFLVNT